MIALNINMTQRETYERAQEVLATVEILSDPELVEQIQQGEGEIAAGEGIALEELEEQVSRDLERDDS